MKRAKEDIMAFVAKDRKGGFQMAHYSTVKDLAKIFHRHPRTVYRWLDEGFIHGKKVRDGWLIPQEEVEKIIKDPFNDEGEPESRKRKF
jgi:excisionase family DNA binding protein